MDAIWDGVREALRILRTGDNDGRGTAVRTILSSGSATGLALLIGIPAGAAIAFGRFRGRHLAMALVNTGMGLPPVVVGFVVALLLWRSGPLGRLELIYTPTAMVVAQAVLALPLVVGFTAAAFGSIPPRMRLQLSALGASRLQALWIFAREARLPLMAAVIAGFGAAISEVGASLMVGGNLAGETRVLTTAVVLETSRGRFDSAIALSIILLALVAAICAILTMIQQKGRSA